MKKNIINLVGISLAGLLCALVLGCETSGNPKTDGIQRHFDENPVEPAVISMTENIAVGINASKTVLQEAGEISVLRAVGGIPPFTWFVANSALGQLNRSSGESVFYTRTGVLGENAVTVVDHRGQVGHIVLISEDPPPPPP